MSDELHVLMKKCEWITREINRTPDKFITLSISFFIPILIAFGLAMSKPEQFQLVYFFIPWFLSALVLFAAYILYAYRGLICEGKYLENRIDSLIGNPVFSYLHTFGDHYFDTPKSYDPLNNKRKLTPFYPLLVTVLIIMIIIYFFCLHKIAILDFCVLNIGFLYRNELVIKWIYCAGVIPILMIIPFYFSLLGKWKYKVVAENIFSYIQQKQEK